MKRRLLAAVLQRMPTPRRASEIYVDILTGIGVVVLIVLAVILFNAAAS